MIDVLSSIANATWLTAPRVRRIAHVSALVGIVIIAGDAWHNTRHGVTAWNGELLGRDFINYWSGAKLAAHGEAATVYNIPAFQRFQVVHTAPKIAWRWYAYPPMTLILTLPLALFGFISGLVFWIIAGFTAICALMSRLVGWRIGALVTAATPAAYINAWSGQNGAFTAALVGSGVILLETRPYLAGVFFGTLCFKPQLGILIPIALAAGGYWRTVMVAALTIISLITASWFFFGTATWTAFHQTAPLNIVILQDNFQNWHRMPTVFAMVRQAGGSVPIAYFVQFLSAAAAAIIVFRIWKRSIPVGVKGAVLIFATFLATPYAWDYDLIVITFALASFWLCVGGDAISAREKYIMAMMMIMPVLMAPIALQTHLQLCPFFLGLALWMIIKRAFQAEKVIRAPTKGGLH